MARCADLNEVVPKSGRSLSCSALRHQELFEKYQKSQPRSKADRTHVVPKGVQLSILLLSLNVNCVRLNLEGAWKKENYRTIKDNSMGCKYVVSRVKLGIGLE